MTKILTYLILGSFQNDAGAGWGGGVRPVPAQPGPAGPAGGAGAAGPAAQGRPRGAWGEAQGGEGQPGKAGGPVQCSALLQGGALVGQGEGETCAARVKLKLDQYFSLKEMVGRPRSEGSLLQ